MRQFSYTIRDALGIHARPAGRMAQTAKAFADTVITISRGEQAAHATQLMKLMGMGVKQGDTVTVTAEGAQEEAAIAAMETLMREHL